MPVSAADVQKVHILLEQCIERAMSKEEAVCALQKVGVDGLLARLVWECLEAENEEFFEAYNASQQQDVFVLDLDLLDPCRMGCCHRGTGGT